MDADLGQAAALNTGERSISLKIAMRLDVELTRAALYGDDRGLDVNCWWSGGTMIRLEGRLRAFWVSLQPVSEYTVTTSKRPAAARCILLPTATIVHGHVYAHCQLIVGHQRPVPVPLLPGCYCAHRLSYRWAVDHPFCSMALHWSGVSTKRTASWNSS